MVPEPIIEIMISTVHVPKIWTDLADVPVEETKEQKRKKKRKKKKYKESRKRARVESI